MREDDILRLCMKCADLAVHDEEYAATLADGLERIMKVDAGVGVITWHLDGDLTDLTSTSPSRALLRSSRTTSEHKWRWPRGTPYSVDLIGRWSTPFG